MAAAKASLSPSQVSESPLLVRHVCHPAGLTHATWQVPGRRALAGQRLTRPSSPTAAHCRVTRHKDARRQRQGSLQLQAAGHRRSGMQAGRRGQGSEGRSLEFVLLGMC